jgi:hypothetical protein
VSTSAVEPLSSARSKRLCNPRDRTGLPIAHGTRAAHPAQSPSLPRRSCAPRRASASRSCGQVVSRDRLSSRVAGRDCIDAVCQARTRHPHTRFGSLRRHFCKVGSADDGRSAVKVAREVGVNEGESSRAERGLVLLVRRARMTHSMPAVPTVFCRRASNGRNDVLDPSGTEPRQQNCRFVCTTALSLPARSRRRVARIHYSFAPPVSDGTRPSLRAQ